MKIKNQFNFFCHFHVICVVYLTFKWEQNFPLFQLASNIVRIKSISSKRSQSQNIWTQFKTSINPIDDTDEWKKSSILMKLITVIRIPAKLFLLFTIPVVDYAENLNGWSKLLNILHCIILPQFGLFVTGYIKFMIFAIPLAVIVFILSCILAITIFFTSKPEKQPTYHKLFVIGSFVGSILVISTVASEIVSLLETFGIAMALSHSLLGMTAMAWGNSVGDLIANITLARKGHQEMGFSACFGSPMFSKFE